MLKRILTYIFFIGLLTSCTGEVLVKKTIEGTHVKVKKEVFSGIQYLSIHMMNKDKSKDVHLIDCDPGFSHFKYSLTSYNKDKEAITWKAVTDTIGGSPSYFGRPLDINLIDLRRFRPIKEIEQSVLKEVVNKDDCECFIKKGYSVDQIIGFVGRE